MQSKVRFLLSLFIGFQSFAVFAHGGDKAGPNGGHIKMPGAFHTELILQPQKDSLQIFLLDLSFKNPVVADSKVEVLYKNGSSTEALECKTSKVILNAP